DEHLLTPARSSVRESNAEGSTAHLAGRTISRLVIPRPPRRGVAHFHQAEHQRLRFVRRDWRGHLSIDPHPPGGCEIRRGVRPTEKRTVTIVEKRVTKRRSRDNRRSWIAERRPCRLEPMKPAFVEQHVRHRG